MNPHSPKVMRRWLVGVIICVSLAVLSNYLMTRHKRSENEKTKKAVDILSQDMMSSAKGIEYSDNKNGITRFKIHADRLVETRSGKNYLDGIEAYDFNPARNINNKIRSQKAVYDNERKLADFFGNVQVLLGNGVEITTESLQYDINTNVASTSDILQLHSQSAGGKARGIRFDQTRELVELGSGVDFTFDRKIAEFGKPTGAGSLHATSENAFISGTQNRIVFQGKARIESKNSGTLSGDSIEVELDPDRRHVTSLVAAGFATYQTVKEGEPRILSGDRMLFSIGESGTLEKVSVVGQAVFAFNSTAEEERLSGGRIDITFDAVKDTISQIQGFNGVSFRMKRGMEQTLMSGEQLTAQFVPETKYLTSIHIVKNAKFSMEGAKDSASNELLSDDILIGFRQLNERTAIDKIRAEGSARWLSAPSGNDAAKHPEPIRRLDASLLEMFFSGDGDYLESGSALGKVVLSEIADNRSVQVQKRSMFADSARFRFFQKNGQLKEMSAEGHIQTTYEKRKPDSKNGSTSEKFRTASDKMKAVFTLKDDGSVLESAAQWGNFTYQDADNSAMAGRCDYDAGKEMLLLRESPKISNAMGSTTGDQVEYNQKQKVLLVRGSVLSKMISPKSKGSFFGSSTSSSSSPGIVIADEMQYWTAAARFRYSGKVRSLSENQQLNARMLDIFNDGERVEAQGDVWHRVKKASQSGKSKEPRNASQSSIVIRSDHLRYMKVSNELTYSGNVVASSADVNLSSGKLDAKLDQDGTIQHATAIEKVRIVQEGGRECTSDVADWSLDTDMLEVKGNPAEIYDPIRGRSRAPRLTYLKANDRIASGK
jgi:LPS export ABC transporter protein LptC